MRRSMAASVAGLALLAQSGIAQECTSDGADLIVSAINSVGNFAAVGEYDAFTANYVACNIGNQAAGWDTSTANHPVFAMGLYRVVTNGTLTRIDQVGMSWAHHAVSGALNSNFCCSGCGSSAITMFLSPRCSTTSSSGFIGTQQYLAPRYQVDPSVGAFNFPFTSAAVQDSTSRRLRARLSDLAGASPTTRYFVEMQLVSADDALDSNVANNTTTREVRFFGTPTDQLITFANGSVSHVGRAAIFEWQAIVPSVVVQTVEVPGDGVIFVAASVAELDGGLYRYDYAIQNLNSDRGVRAFTIPLGFCADVDQLGFHDVEYHSGDGIGDVNADGTDWQATITASSVTWATATFDENPSANAIRWGTMYNFSFVSDAQPNMNSTATLSLFKSGEPATIEIAGIPAPRAAAATLGDVNGDCSVDLTDLAQLLGAFGLCDGQPGYLDNADLTDDGCINLGDLALLLANFGQ